MNRFYWIHSRIFLSVKSVFRGVACQIGNTKCISMFNVGHPSVPVHIHTHTVYAGVYAYTIGNKIIYRKTIKNESEKDNVDNAMPYSMEYCANEQLTEKKEM